MTNSTTVWRTAPIAIAPKPPGYNATLHAQHTNASASGSPTVASSSLPGGHRQVAASTIDLCRGSMPGRHYLEPQHSQQHFNNTGAVSQSHDHEQLNTHGGKSLLSSALNSRERSSGTNLSNSTSPVQQPCASCAQSRLPCTALSDDEDSGCVRCKLNGCQCSLAGLTSPQRKRKLTKDNGNNSKRSSPDRPADIRRRQAPNANTTTATTNNQSTVGRQHHGSPSLSSTAGSASFLEDMANIGGPIQLKRTLGMQDDRYSQYIGPTTDFEPSLINLTVFNPDDESLLARGTLRKVSDDDIFLMLPDSQTPGHERETADLDAIERIVAPYGPDLIDLYFEVVHPGFPIIQKTVFTEKYERSYRELMPSLLAAVYLLAINWWEHSPQLASLPRPDVAALETLMRSTFNDAMFRPKLSVIQAGLLLSQRPAGDQWAPTAQLVAVSQELGLHLDCSAWKIPPWEKGLRKRLAWALYMQDKWGALVHGRPSHIFATNWGVTQINDNDFPDVEWDESDVEERVRIEQGRVLFMNMIQLSQILAEILDTFYTLQAMRAAPPLAGNSTAAILMQAKPIQLKLKEWYATLPRAIRMDSAYYANPSTPGHFSSIGYLHLAYFATEITLHRRIIRAFAAHPDATDPFVSQICRSAAKARLISAMDFVNRLTPQHLRSFWYFASKTNFALIGTFGSLLWATALAQEEAEWFRRRLGEYRWTLSVSSKPGEGKGLTEFAMGMLDISTGLLKKLPEKPPMSRSGSVADLPPVGLAGSAMSFGGLAPISGVGMAGMGGEGFDDGMGMGASPQSLTDDSSDDDMDYDGYQPMSSIQE